MANGIDRRDFLKVVGTAGAGAGIFGCGPAQVRDAERLLPYVTAPEEIVPGLATSYRTTCRECPAGCGMSVRTREGRAIKAEGNPLSSISHGSLCARGQASLHGLYNPNQIPQALARGAAGEWERLGWDEAEQRLVQELAQAQGRRVLLTHTFTGSMDALVDQWAAAFGLERLRFDTFGHEALRTASLQLFGVDAVPVHDFSNADVVITFGADFLETWISPIDYSHGFVQGHAYDQGRRGRLVSVTPHQSLTDMNADDWLPIRPGTEHLVALAMARVIVDTGLGQAGGAAALLQGVDIRSAAETSGISEDRIRSIARDFARNGRSLAVGPGVQSSHRAATAVAFAVAVLNSVAGNIGATVRFDRLEQHTVGGTYRDLQALMTAMQGGQVGALLVMGPNPLHSVPLADSAEAALANVGFVASFSQYLDETSRRAHMLLPDHHFLESWGDYVPRTGVFSMVQPVMMPVFDTKQTGDVLLSTARRAGLALETAATTYYDFVRERWAQLVFPQAGTATSFDDWWRASLQTGVVTLDVPAVTPVLNGATLAQIRYEPAEFIGPDDAEFYLVVYPSLRFYDGRLANRPWLQELPDPVSKVSWTSWVEMNPARAEQLGLDDGSIVVVRTSYGEASLPVWRHPGIRPDTIAVQLGQGHEEHGRYAAGRGVNAAKLISPLVDEQSGGLVWFQARASVRATGKWERIPLTEGSKTDAGRQIARTTTLSLARAADAGLIGMAVPQTAHGDAGYAGAGADAAHPTHRGLGMEPDLSPGRGSKIEGESLLPMNQIHPQNQTVWQLQEAGGFAPAVVNAGPGDFPPPGTHYGEYSHTQPRWGMSIDMERCTGCSACVTACYAENNIGITGPEQIAMGRILTWIRIERYFPEDDQPERGVRFLPMLCQQCGTAPCEPVCPVYAAYHTPDGLNGQIYNRCVGTRYCANNCPYKVRYFNWYSWEWPEPLNWQLNPDVTVREKGVMEKCTFCVQRIRDAQHSARLDGSEVPDGEIKPACAQTCPGEAIVFGNIKDPNSRVARIAASGRGYRVLEDLNTQSGIVYLQKVILEGAEA